MRVLLVIPSSHSLPVAVTDRFGKELVVGRMPRELGKIADLEIPDPLSTKIFILNDPAAIDDSQLVPLIEEGIATAATGMAVAFVPGTGVTSVLATAAAAYAFDGHAVHLAGGLDPTLSIDELGLDTQFRLAGRAVKTVAIGSKAVTSQVELPVTAYLNVLTKNVTSQVQAGLLAPLFAGIVHHSLQISNTDTSQLDLQRSPGGDDQPLLQHPSGAFSGAETLRKWAAAVPDIESKKFITSEARRIPDRRIPHLDQFIEEVWQATGIGAEQRSMLEMAFAEITSTDRPQIIFGLRASDKTAVERMEAIAANLAEPLYWWDPQSQRLLERPSGATEWQESDSSIESAGNDTTITYAIGIQAREIPWQQLSPSIFIADFTTTDVVAEMKSEWARQSIHVPLSASHATLFMETIRQADALIANSIYQRDFLLGAVAGIHRLNQYTYDEDPSLGSLISVENGTKAAQAAISRPVHPFERVRTTPEYERSPHAVLAKSSVSVKNSVVTLQGKAKDKLRGIRQ